MRLRGEDGRPHPPVFSRQLRALARTLHAASLCSIFNHKFSETAGRRIAVPIPNLRFRHSTVRRQGARRPPPREDPAQARHAPAGGFDNRTTGCSSSCLHEFRTAKLRRGSRTFAHDQVRRGWSKIITIIQWVLIFEQSVNHRREPRWWPQIGAAATWLPNRCACPQRSGESSGSNLSELLDDLPQVPANRVQLRQVIVNLLMNAVDAMDAVTDGARAVRIKTEIYDPNYLLIAVGDTGTGIDPQHIDRIFDAFFSAKPNGMGMGLSICRSIIEAHGGRVWATTNVPRGAVFQFTLPRQRETAS